MFIVLFGLSGTGKNYVSNIMQKNLHFYVLDGDELLPADMRDSISNKTPFTQQQRDHFTETLITAAKKINEPNMVLVQALYKNSNRRRIADAFPDCQFIQVQSDPEIIAIRLQERGKINDLDYARKISQYFEPPAHPFMTIANNVNNDEAGIMYQLKLLLPAMLVPDDLAVEETSRFRP